MDILLIIAVIMMLLVGLFDLVPYFGAAAILGRYPPGGPYTWQFLKRVFRRKPKYATWKDIK